MIEREFHLPQKRRFKAARSFRMTERDVEIVRAVHRYRMLEQTQVENLFFAPTLGQQTNTKRSRERLRLLYQHGYLERILRPFYPSEANKGPVYRLGVNGARLLAYQDGIPLEQFRYWGRGDDKDRRQTRVQPLFLEHGLALSDVRIAVERSAKQHACNLEMWLDESDLKHPQYLDAVSVFTPAWGKAERIPIAPDSYFVLNTARGRGCFFVEVDRSTETLGKHWRRKILGYKEYVLTGKFHKRYGVPWPHTPLRILTTTLSLARAENLRAAVEKYGSPQATKVFLFAPLQQVIAQDILTSPIWLRAGSKELTRLL